MKNGLIHLLGRCFASVVFMASVSVAKASDNAQILSEYQKQNCAKWPDPAACNQSKTFPDLTDLAEKGSSSCNQLPPSDGYGVTQDVVDCVKQYAGLKKQVNNFFTSWKGSGGAGLQSAPATDKSVK